MRTFRQRMEERAGRRRARARRPWPSTPRARVARARDEFWQAMADDLNTPEALAALLTLVTDLNALDDWRPLPREERDAWWRSSTRPTASSRRGPAPSAQSLDAEVEALIAARKRRQGGPQLAGGRPPAGPLKSMGILLEDRKDGTVRWKRTE